MLRAWLHRALYWANNRLFPYGIRTIHFPCLNRGLMIGGDRYPNSRRFEDWPGHFWVFHWSPFTYGDLYNSSKLRAWLLRQWPQYASFWIRWVP